MEVRERALRLNQEYCSEKAGGKSRPTALEPVVAMPLWHLQAFLAPTNPSAACVCVLVDLRADLQDRIKAAGQACCQA